SSSGAANINCLYASDGSVFWQYNIGGQIHPSPSVVDGYVYVGSTNGWVYCLDEDGFTDGNDGWTGEANTGSGYGDVIWSYSIGGQIWGSPAVANDKVFIASTNGNIYCLGASDGAYIWDTDLDSQIYSSPAVADGKVLITNMSGHLSCLYQNNGTINWSYNTGIGSLYSSPSIANDRVYVNSFGGFICFGLPDTSLPTVEYVDPIKDAINVSIATNITIGFNESMDRSSTENAFSISPGIAGSFYWPNSLKLVFDPTNPLASLTTYTVELAATAKDVSDNPLDGNENGIADSPSSLDDYSWSFTTLETSSPRVVTTNPKNNDENVSLSSDIKIIFNEAMNQTTAEQAFYIIPATAGSFSWQDNNLTFQPSAQLIPDTIYSLAINSTASDLIGNKLDGDKDTIPEGSPIDDYTWYFTTLEITPPQITSVSPADQAQDVLINTELQINFDEPMNQSAVELAFEISPNVAGIFTSANGGSIITFSPENNLEDGTEYTVNITSIATDLVGNFLDGDANGIAEGSPADDYSWCFNTSVLPDDTPPLVLSTVPSDSSANVNVSSEVNITFDEPMNQPLTESGFLILPSVDGIFSWDLAGQVMTFTLTSKLEYDTEYSILLRGNLAQDLAGNTLDGNSNTISDGTPADDYSWRFTTESEPIIEVQYPKIVAVTPIDKATEVEVAVNIEITFDKEMNMAAAQFAFIITPSVAGAFDWDNNKMIYNPNIDLEYFTTYTVQIDTSATDLDGNPLDGNNNNVSEGSPYDDYTWEFTTISNPDIIPYDLNITGVTEIDIRVGESETYTITITNIGLLDDVVIPGLNAGSLDNYTQLSDTTTRTLQSQDSWAINLALVIPLTAKTGEYDIAVEATSQGGGFTINHPIKVNILPLDPTDDGDGDSEDETLSSLLVFGIILIIIIIIIIIIIVLLVLKKRKRPKHYEPTPVTPYAQLPTIAPLPPPGVTAGQPMGVTQYQYPPTQQIPPPPQQQAYSISQPAVPPPSPPLAAPVTPPGLPPQQVSWDEQVEE
ncbi:MAG: Ig-like domain-containing protein, partial [Thermoplasmata archaeon]|nr:Ig-like domain-containing protein [Thermoplasmata archaeon]